MKIKFRKRFLILNAFLGIIWTAIGLVGIIFSETAEIKFQDFNFFGLGIGVIYLALFLFEFNRNNLEINNEEIILNALPNRRIKIKDLSAAEYNAPIYHFRSLKKEILINQSQIRKEDSSRFEEAFTQIKNKVDAELGIKS